MQGGGASSPVVKIAVSIAALLCAAYGGRGLLASYYASRAGLERIEGIHRAARLVPEEWRYRLDLAEIASALGRHQEAIEEYEGALAVYPGCSRCWMGLAETQASSGADPTDSLQKAVSFGRSETRVRLRAATVYARVGRHEEAGSEFLAARKGMGDEGGEVYALLHRVYSSEFILDRLVRAPELGSYFAFVRRDRPISDARVVWERFQRETADRGGSQRKAYAQRLLAEGHVGEAWDVLFADQPRAHATVLDGGFEEAIDVRPFGWYTNPGDGVEVQTERCSDCPEGSRALRMVFGGKSNPQYGGTWQDVPVHPGGRYALRAMARTEHITSTNGPRLAVRGIARKGVPAGCDLWVASPDLKLSLPWQPIELEFAVPESCDGIRILVARQASTQFNKFIGGELWIDDVRLVAVH